MGHTIHTPSINMVNSHPPYMCNYRLLQVAFSLHRKRHKSSTPSMSSNSSLLRPCNSYAASLLPISSPSITPAMDHEFPPLIRRVHNKTIIGLHTSVTRRQSRDVFLMYIQYWSNCFCTLIVIQTILLIMHYTFNSFVCTQ